MKRECPKQKFQILKLMTIFQQLDRLGEL